MVEPNNPIWAVKPSDGWQWRWSVVAAAAAAVGGGAEVRDEGGDDVVKVSVVVMLVCVVVVAWWQRGWRWWCGVGDEDGSGAMPRWL
ncbi:hypothetical protein Tco_1435863 [Tanacetum coccineum]